MLATKGSLTHETQESPQTPPIRPIPAESTYRLLGVNFDMRKSMSSPTP